MSENDVTFHEPMPGVNSGEIDGLYSKNWLNYSDPSSQRTYFSEPPEQVETVHYSRTKRAIYGALAAAVLALQLSGPFSASESSSVIPADKAASDNSDPSSTRIKVHPVEPIPDSQYLYPIPDPDEVIATNATIPEHVLFMPVVQEPQQDLLSQIKESLATIGITTETLTDLRPQNDESEAQLRKLAVIFEKLAENWRRFEAILAPHGDAPSNKQHFNEISIREAIDNCSTRVGLITRSVTIPSSAPPDDDCFSAEAYHMYQQYMNLNTGRNSFTSEGDSNVAHLLYQNILYMSDANIVKPDLEDIRHLQDFFRDRASKYNTRVSFDVNNKMVASPTYFHEAFNLLANLSGILEYNPDLYQTTQEDFSTLRTKVMLDGLIDFGGNIDNLILGQFILNEYSANNKIIPAWLATEYLILYQTLVKMQKTNVALSQEAYENALAYLEKERVLSVVRQSKNYLSVISVQGSYDDATQTISSHLVETNQSKVEITVDISYLYQPDTGTHYVAVAPEIIETSTGFSMRVSRYIYVLINGNPTTVDLKKTTAYVAIGEGDNRETFEVRTGLLE